MNEQLRYAMNIVELHAQQLPDDTQNLIAAHLLEDLKEQGQITLASQPPSLTVREFIEKQYHEGKLLNIPTRQAWTQEEREERERLVQELAGGKTISIAENLLLIPYIQMQETCVVPIHSALMMPCN